MYCAGCGTQIQTGLNYCSRCGRRVADEGKWKSDTNPIAVAGNTAAIGFVAFIFVILIMSKTGVASNLFVPVTFIYFAALAGLCLMILRDKFTSARQQEDPAFGQNEQRYLHPVTTAQLTEAAERPASVTEHTTRTLDAVPMDRN